MLEIHKDDARSVSDMEAIETAAPIPKSSFTLTEGEDETAITMDQDMPVMQALRAYSAAVGWCVVISTSLVMESYDTSMVVNLPANIPFAQQFGLRSTDGTYQLDPTWQSALGIAPTIGIIVGLLINGVVADWYGYRKVIFVSLVCVTGLFFIPFFAKSLGVMVAGFLLLGVPFGVLQTSCVAYAAEACPVSLRGYLTTYTNMCWVVGQLIGAGAFRGTTGMTDEWSYRIPLAIQWVWPLPIAVAVVFAPESPWWLLRQDRREDARASLRRLTSSNFASIHDIEVTLMFMDRISAKEKALFDSKQSTYLDCFRGTNLRRTEIVCITWLTQVTCGIGLLSYSSYFFQQVGLSTRMAFTMTMVISVMGIVGNLFTWFLMDRFGRRTLYFVGTILLSLLTTSVGIAGSAGNSRSSAWAMVGLILAFAAVYDCTVGPICYALVSEVPSTYLRAKTMVLGSTAYNAGVIVLFFLVPRMVNHSAWNWGGKAGFFWGGIAALTALWMFFRLPETKGRTYGELDVLFEQKTPARKFKETAVRSDPIDHTDGRIANDAIAELPHFERTADHA